MNKIELQEVIFFKYIFKYILNLVYSLINSMISSPKIPFLIHLLTFGESLFLEPRRDDNLYLILGHFH